MEIDKSNKNQSSITDLAYLQNISDGNKEFMEEMINLFIDQSEGHINAFREGIAEKDFGLLAKAAHKMKPVLGYVGMSPEEHHLIEIEKAAREEKDFEHIIELLEKLEASIVQANSELKDYLASVN